MTKRTFMKVREQILNSMERTCSLSAVIQTGLQNFSIRKKREVIQLYQKTMGAETAGVLSTMVLGDRQLLEPEIKSLYQKTGISHILAISGLHVSIIGMGFYKMLQKQRVPLLLRSTLSAVAILVFAVLSGAGVSTKRAVLMFLLLLFGGVIGRSYDSLTGLALAAIFFIMGKSVCLCLYRIYPFILSSLRCQCVCHSVEKHGHSKGDQRADMCQRMHSGIYDPGHCILLF